MNEESDPDPEQIASQPKPFNSVAYWLFGVLIFLVVSYLVALSIPIILSGKKNPNRTEAISNLKQVGLALYEFHSQYGVFPDDQTAELVRQNHPTKFNLSGTSSNTLFRQLFAAKIVDNEAIFYAKFPGVSRPDGDTSPGHLLEKGEVAFAYIAGLSTETNPSLPIAFGPVIPSTGRFDPKPFDGKAVVLRIDGSVSTISINKNGDAMIGGGESLLDPNNRLWNGKAPDIRYPE